MTAVEPYSGEQFARAQNVSRETMTHLQTYVDELCRWQRTINLVGPETLGDVWRRHILDSAQVKDFIPGDARRILDMGSGAGFPGLVLALLMASTPGVEVILVEANVRKSAFLRHIIALTGAPAMVVTQRLDLADLKPVDVICARALAPVAKLLEFARPFTSGHTRCVFLKGQNLEFELTNASKYWNMQTSQHPSISDPSGKILVVKEYFHVSDSFENGS